MALQTKIGGSLLQGGLMVRARGTLARIRNTVRPPRLNAEAARVVVKDTAGAIDQAFIAAYVGDSIPKELWGYYKNGDLKAVLSVSYDETNTVYKYVVSKICPETLTVEFDAVAIGNLGAVTGVDLPATGQITHQAAALTA